MNIGAIIAFVIIIVFLLLWAMVTSHKRIIRKESQKLDEVLFEKEREQ